MLEFTADGIRFSRENWFPCSYYGSQGIPLERKYLIVMGGNTIDTTSINKLGKNDRLVHDRVVNYWTLNK